MDELLAVRRNGLKLLVGASLVATLVIGIGTALSDTGVLPLILALAVSAIPLALVFQGRADAGTRLAMGSAIAALPMILLYQWTGHPLMADIHMTFFAALAMLAAMADWRPVILAAGLTAVHHLLTNFLAPDLVWTGGPAFARVLFHAVVVIAETGALVILCEQVARRIQHQAELRAQAERIEAEAAASGLVCEALVEVNLAGDPGRTGVMEADVAAVLEAATRAQHVRVLGLMGMAAVPDGEESGVAARRQFARLRELRDELVGRVPSATGLHELSMGMSGDFVEAILEGSTLVRVGSALWEGIEG